MELSYDDFRGFVEQAKKVSDWRLIEGADWNTEIGALVESTAELVPQPPMLIFDRIKDYPPGFRVVSLPYAAYKRVALALGLPVDKSKLEILRLAARKITTAKPIPPKVVQDSPLLENVMNGDNVDLLKFPALRFHENDGGRYFGPGGGLINADPETGYVNTGTYRMQLHDRNHLGLWMSPGQNGRQICMKYWQQGKSCPVAASYGQHPLVFMPSYTKHPYGCSEMEISGGLIGRALEVVKGPITGLPIAASSEIAIEGEVPPPLEEARDEGPFGEWPGYYSGGTIGTGEPQPVIRVKAIYYRNNPILEDEAPLWPGAVKMDLHISAGVLWDQLESAGIQDIVGVYNHTSYLSVVAIRQRYAGHAKQAGLAVLSCSAGARNGRYVVVVDEDIDPSNLKEVLWAMMTRVDPKTNIEIIDGCWSTPLDPRMPPEKRESRDHTNSRAVFYAVRPFHWRDKFPQVSRCSRELRDKTVEKYKDVIPFPKI
ncbi:MAG: UbiD family decarboxylase [Deltaproteobacteria bacterium]|nr:UbiD family decarboxylase [Deltaproteobacteria bacterium]